MMHPLLKQFHLQHVVWGSKSNDIHNNSMLKEKLLQENAAFPKFHALEVEIPPAYNTNKRVTISLSETFVICVLFKVMYIIFRIHHIGINDPPLHGYRCDSCIMLRACNLGWNGCVRSWRRNLSHMFWVLTSSIICGIAMCSLLPAFGSSWRSM